MTHRKTPPRLVPDMPLPPYAYVSGRFPHPVSDPRGHSYGAEPETSHPLDPEHWQDCRPYLYGIDLFNHGYYWEAHEVWEGLWHACGRSGALGSFLQGLIKLAAAGVKIREGRPQGAKRHARRAAELFGQTAQDIGDQRTRYMGLSLPELTATATEIARHPPAFTPDPNAVVEVVFDFVLWPC